MRWLLSNVGFAGSAWFQADYCAQIARHGVFVGLLALFFCLLTNHLVAAWLKLR